MSSAMAPAALRYLQNRRGVFWRWSATGDAIEWHDGGTIVFADELREILAQLAPQGLPPFDPLVLVLAMCRDDFAARLCAALPEPVVLDLRVPAELRRGATAKATLVAMLLEARPTESKAIGTAVVQALTSGLPAEALQQERTTGGLSLAQCFALLAEGLAVLDRHAFAMRLKTGLGELPVAAALELGVAARAHRLVDELRDDSTLGGVASLARELMAALYVPRPISEPDDLPLGGISDLTNHGAFDRLLLSELAHDPDVLMTRVALGEALYLRREKPPRSQGGCRCVLVDTGVRTWGLPRVFAASVALALAATTPKDHELRAFAADGARLDPLVLDRREGLEALLEHMRTDAHPGAALPAFVVACRKQARPVEVVVVAQRDSLMDPAFDRALEVTRQAGLEVLLAAVDRDGSFELIAVSPRGRRRLETAQLDLRVLLPRSPHLHAASAPQLPVLLTRRRLPFLFPHAKEPGHVRVDAVTGTVSVTRDGRLLHSWRLETCAHELTAELPQGELLHLSPVVDNEVVIVQRNEREQFDLMRIDVKSGSIALFELTGFWDRRVRFVQQGASLLAIERGRVRAVSTRTGEVGTILQLPGGVSGVHGHFFADAARKSWFALHHAGLSLRLEPIPLPSKAAIVGFLAVNGGKETWALAADGKLWTGAGRVGGAVALPHPASQTLAASDHGDTLLLELTQGCATVSAVTTAPFTARVRHGTVEHLGWTRRQRSGAYVATTTLAGRMPICTALDGVAVQGSEVLLAGRRTRVIEVAQQWVEDPDPDPDLLARFRRLSLRLRVRSDRHPSGTRPFEPIAPAPGTRCSLHVATWRNGSRVYLDGRGLLHFVSADRSLPQFTIFLVVDSALACWSSDGATCGPEELLATSPSGGVEPFVHLLRSFAEATR